MGGRRTKGMAEDVGCSGVRMIGAGAAASSPSCAAVVCGRIGIGRCGAGGAFKRLAPGVELGDALAQQRQALAAARADEDARRAHAVGSSTMSASARGRSVSSMRSSLLKTTICGTSAAPISASTRCTSAHLRRRARGWRRRRHAAAGRHRPPPAASPGTPRSASCGRSRMKPTVSDSDDRARDAVADAAGASWCRASRTAGRRRTPRR